MSQKCVLITGGTGTLGSAIARELRASFRVFVNYCRDERRAHALQREIGCELCRADIGDEAAVATMFAALPSLFAVIHAAAIARDALLLRQSRESWDETLRVNCDGAFLVTRAALEKLEPDGRLIFLGSRTGEQGGAGQAAYSASKAALLGLMKCAAREGAARGIAVNAICPGFVPSALSANLGENSLRHWRDRSILNEFGTPAEIVALISLLLGPSGAAISGQIIHCDSRL